MPQLLVRNLDPGIVEALKVRAVKHGRSTEAEHRAILEGALRLTPPDQDFKAFLRAAPGTPGLRSNRSKDRRPLTL